ncbi:MAG: RnfABCDGE type electron transport complex subunit G [Clostridia bacterium]|nr:RnfABCDGE type electron transport complex subunit G [Clostridia bacterium]
MKEKAFGYVVKLGITLLLITAIVAGLLGAVNYITKEKITENTDQKIREAISLVLPDASGEPEKGRLTEADEKNGIKAIYCVGDSYALELEVSGSQGIIDLMVGVDTSGTVQGVQIISHSETPGLGAVAASNGAKGESFRSQFVDKSGEIKVTKDGGEIAALTGATVSSRAICKAVSIATAYVEGVQK